MGIKDRIVNITKSYVNSAKDKLEDNWDELSFDKLSEELSDCFSRLKQKNNTSGMDGMSEEELDAYIGNQYETPEYEQRQRQSTHSKANVKLTEAYTKLGVSPTDSLSKIGKAYKKEIMKYHPDRFAQDPEKAKIATKVSQLLSEAYATIEASRK